MTCQVDRTHCSVYLAGMWNETLRKRLHRIQMVANARYVAITNRNSEPDWIAFALDLRDLENQCIYAREELVLQMRHDGWTWEEIGNALLVSRQAAWERYAPECDDLEGVTELQAVELRNMQKPVTSRNATPFSRPR